MVASVAKRETPSECDARYMRDAVQSLVQSIRDGMSKLENGSAGDVLLASEDIYRRAVFAAWTARNAVKSEMEETNGRDA
jgi:hypothetical protein